MRLRRTRDTPSDKVEQTEFKACEQMEHPNAECDIKVNQVGQTDDERVYAEIETYAEPLHLNDVCQL